MNGGSWLDPAPTNRSKTPFQKWQPDGCTLRPYGTERVTECLGNAGEQENVFIGDSTTRQLFWAVARSLNRKRAAQENSKASKHADITFTEGTTSIDFVWDPLLNGPRTSQYIQDARNRAGDPDNHKKTGFMVFGVGLWFTLEDRSVEMFKEAVDRITDQLPPPNRHSRGEHRPLILPIQLPYYEKLDKYHQEAMSAEKLNAMNGYLEEISANHDVDIAGSFLSMVMDLPSTYYESTGRHVLSQVADRQAELLFNMRCNNGVQSYPFEGTCCLHFQRGWMQFIIILAGSITFLAVALLDLQSLLGSTPSGLLQNVEKHSDILRPLLVLWAALLYSYTADRTHFFDKVSKLYNTQDFIIFCVGIFVSGLATIRRSGGPITLPPKSPLDRATVSTDQPVLSRDQTDEWKGWMQLLILAYHYTGASKILGIYKVIRLLVASYLFMSGYGHAAYFYQKNDYSMKRVVGVLVRLNLLSCALPWIMQTDYLFYYFAPLVTYWYLIVYATMRVKSGWNKQMPLFLLKIALAAATTTLIHTQHWVFEPFCMVANKVFGAKWEANEWLFRVGLDQYIVYVGMVVSVLYIRVTKGSSTPTPLNSRLSAAVQTRFNQFVSPEIRERLSSPQVRRVALLLSQFAMLVASVVALIVYWGIAGTKSTKTRSNQFHPFISPLPILAFVYLRNQNQLLRNHYSALFAWIGRISLETFVLQYHIWLAADTKGLLSTGLFGNGGMAVGFLGVRIFGDGMGAGRWADCLILGAVFVFVSWKVAGATGAMTGAVVRALYP